MDNGAWCVALGIYSNQRAAERLNGQTSGNRDHRSGSPSVNAGPIEQQIAKTEHRVNSVSNAALRKSAFRLLIWQEAQRETLHGIPAPTREAP